MVRPWDCSPRRAALLPNSYSPRFTREHRQTYAPTRKRENRDELTALVSALGSADVRVVRLEASAESRADRIRSRELGNLLDLFLQKTDPLAEQMRRFGIGDLVVNNDNWIPQEVANEVLSSMGWL